MPDLPKEREDLADPIYNVPLDHMADDRALAYSAPGKLMPEPGDEDTTEIDRELIASELDKVARLAGRNNQIELATEIGYIVSKIRKTEEGEKA